MANVIAIVVVLNLVIQELPSSFREIDLSSEKLYTIGDQTKELLDDLDKDVDLYYIAQDGTEAQISSGFWKDMRKDQTYKSRAERSGRLPHLHPAVYFRFCK